MEPACDPNSTKYPDRTYHGGRWETPEQIEKTRARWLKNKKSEKGRASDARYRKSEKNRDKQRRNQGRDHLLGLPLISRAEASRRAGLATQDLYDRDPEAWARNKRAQRAAGLARTRKRLEKEDTNG